MPDFTFQTVERNGAVGSHFQWDITLGRAPQLAADLATETLESVVFWQAGTTQAYRVHAPGALPDQAPTTAHSEADNSLLSFTSDPEITDAFLVVHREYA